METAWSRTLNVDEWSGGGWTALFDNIQQLLAHFESDECTFETAEMRQMIEKDLPFYSSELENMIRQSRLAALNSQMRINIADLVVQALKEQGFSLEDAGYDNVDMRQGYGARLVNYEGGEVLVQVSPTGAALGENELHLESLDRERKTEHELRQRWTEIHRSLQRKGINWQDQTQVNQRMSEDSIRGTHQTTRRISNRPAGK